MHRLTAALVLLACVWSWAVPVAAVKTVLTMAPWGGFGSKSAGAMEQTIAEYEALHPDISIEIIELPLNFYEGLPKLLMLSQMPDVVEAHLALMPELMKAGVPGPMPEDLAAEARRFFFQPTLVPFTYGGKLYGVPTEYQLYALVYNDRIRAELGMAGAPRTWQEMRAMAAKGTKREGDWRVVRSGFGFPRSWANHGEYSTHAFLAMLWSNGGTYVDETGKVRLTEQPAIETMEFLSGMMREQIASISHHRDIPTDKTFMTIAASWARGDLAKAMNDDFANVTSTLVPHGKGSFATTQYGWGFIVPAKAQHPKEAWEFLTWLTMREGPNRFTRTGYAMAVNGSMPTNQWDLRLRNELYEVQFYRGFMDGMPFARPEPSYPQIMTRWKELGKALEPVLKLQVPPAQGLASAQASVSRVLAEASNVRIQW